MHNEPDVRLVDTHPESVCRDDRLEPAGHEAILGLVPGLRREPAMIAARLRALRSPAGARHLVAVLDGRDVDDARPVGAAQQIDQRAAASSVRWRCARPRSAGSAGTTPMLTIVGWRSPSCLTTSSRTRSVAVAVRASTGGRLSALIAAPRERKAGRKSCPQSDRQCASSTTKRSMVMPADQRQEFRIFQALRGHEDEVDGAPGDVSPALAARSAAGTASS